MRKHDKIKFLLERAKLFFEKCTERKKQHTEEVKCGLPLRKADYNP